MNDAEKVGLLIKQKRIEKGLTQKDLANKLFVENTTISRWECGLGYPNVSILPKLCEVLELDINDLLLEQYKDSNPKTIESKLLGIRIANLILCIMSLLIATFSLVYLFLRKTKSVTYFFFDSQNEIMNTVLFVISIVLLASLLIFSLISLIMIALKRKIIIVLPYLCFAASLGQSISSIILLFSNSNTLYFGILAALMQVSNIISVSLVLLNINVRSNVLRIVIFALFGIISLTNFCLLHISISYATINISTILYEFALYMPIVIYNSLACYFMAHIFCKNRKTAIIVTASVFVLLNILFALQFTSSPIIGAILKILIIIGLINSSANILYIYQIRRLNDGKR